MKGNVYVADGFNNRIRKITPAGTVSTLAGSTMSGFADGQGANARFNLPSGIAVDASGIVYVADENNSAIRMITPDGVVSTLAGSLYGNTGLVDGQGTNTLFNYPYDLAVDGSGNVYVADHHNMVIRKITPIGNVTTLHPREAGNNILFRYPTGIAVDSNGNIYVCTFPCCDGEPDIRKIWKITPDGVATSLAGGTQGYLDGPGVNAMFSHPWSVAVDVYGIVYVGDNHNPCVRKITPDGNVSTLAGGIQGYVDGPGVSAKFAAPWGIAVDAKGNVYVADGNRIRKIVIN